MTGDFPPGIRVYWPIAEIPARSDVPEFSWGDCRVARFPEFTLDQWRITWRGGTVHTLEPYTNGDPFLPPYWAELAFKNRKAAERALAEWQGDDELVLFTLAYLGEAS